MITIITRVEDTQMPLDVDQHLWRQVRGAFQTKSVVYVSSDEELQAALDKATTIEVTLTIIHDDSSSAVRRNGAM